ncbi:MAG: flagellar protein FlaG [Candidatus Riflebacteria bacterium]|nr:flagellar protein FlaG [Candidatus Riflebacteria bacterium]
MNDLSVNTSFNPLAELRNNMSKLSDAKVAQPDLKEQESAKPSLENNLKAAEEEREKFEDYDLQEVLDKLNDTASIFNYGLKFAVHEHSHTTIVSVINKHNNKLIRQFPSEEILNIFAKIDDYIGMLFDAEA